MASRFHSLLRSKIEKRLEERIFNLVGGGAGSKSEYREQVGYIEALKDTLKDCEDVEREMT